MLMASFRDALTLSKARIMMVYTVLANQLSAGLHTNSFQNAVLSLAVITQSDVASDDVTLIKQCKVCWKKKDLEKTRKSDDTW